MPKNTNHPSSKGTLVISTPRHRPTSSVDRGLDDQPLAALLNRVQLNRRRARGVYTFVVQWPHALLQMLACVTVLRLCSMTRGSFPGKDWRPR